jgi:glutamate synthase (NADPH/NADH) small chain
VAIIGSGPAGLINAYLVARDGYPVTVFEAFHELGGVLRYGIPEFRLPNELIDDVVEKCKLLGVRFVNNFVVGKTATLQDLLDAGFWRVFVGTGAGLPTFLNVPGEHLLNIMSANEFLTRVNLMHADREDWDTPLPEVRDKRVLIIGGGNTAMDAARTARRLGGNVTIVYRRTKAEMPAREEELAHAIEEGIELATQRTPVAFEGDEKNFLTTAVIETMTLGAPDASGRRRPVPTGVTERMPADLVIMALGNTSNPIIRDSEPRLKVTPKGAIQLKASTQKTSLAEILSGGDATRGGSTAIRAAGDGQQAAREMLAGEPVADDEVAGRLSTARRFTEMAGMANKILRKIHLSVGIEEFVVSAPAIAKSARAGQVSASRRVRSRRSERFRASFRASSSAWRTLRTAASAASRARRLSSSASFGPGRPKRRPRNRPRRPKRPGKGRESFLAAPSQAACFLAAWARIRAHSRPRRVRSRSSS